MAVDKSACKSLLDWFRGPHAEVQAQQALSMTNGPCGRKGPCGLHGSQPIARKHGLQLGAFQSQACPAQAQHFVKDLGRKPHVSVMEWTRPFFWPNQKTNQHACILQLADWGQFCTNETRQGDRRAVFWIWLFLVSE